MMSAFPAYLESRLREIRRELPCGIPTRALVNVYELRVACMTYVLPTFTFYYPYFYYTYYIHSSKRSNKG